MASTPLQLRPGDAAQVHRDLVSVTEGLHAYRQPPGPGTSGRWPALNRGACLRQGAQGLVVAVTEVPGADALHREWALLLLNGALGWLPSSWLERAEWKKP